MRPSVSRAIVAVLAVAVLTGCDDPTSLKQLSLVEAAARAASALTMNATAVSATAIQIAWNDDVRDELGWEVHRSTSGAAGSFMLRASLPANSGVHVDNGLAPLTEYCYKVRSFKKPGPKTMYGAFSNVACATTPTPPLPAAPTALDARPQDGSGCCRINFSWTDNSTDDNGFILEQAGAPEGPWSFLASTTSPGWTIYNVPEEQQLCYRVLARRDTVRSLPSNVDCTAFPRAPSGLSGSGVAGVMNLSWADNSAVEDGYAVERATIDPWEPYAVIATLPPNAATYRDVTAAPDTRYQYRVWALREGARAASSYEVIAVAATVPPPAPTELTATPWSSTSVSVNATSSYTNETGWRLERSSDGVNGWTTVATHTSSGIADVGLQTEQRVCYRMFAFNSQGESPPSPVDCTAPPAAPSDIAVVPLADGTSRITWRDNSNIEDGYLLVFNRLTCDSGECWEEMVLVDVAANVTEYVATDQLLAIQAMKDGGYSDWVSYGTSASASATAALRTKVTAELRRTLDAKAAMRRHPR